MNIGELAKQTGLTASKIRFYEGIGLLTLVDRRPNGYRTYPAAAVMVLNIISIAQRAGFSLDEIRALLPADLEHWEHEALVTALTRKIADIEALEARLAQSKAHLLHLLGEIQSRPDDIDCVDNAKRILSRIHDYADAPPKQVNEQDKSPKQEKPRRQNRRLA